MVYVTDDFSHCFRNYFPFGAVEEAFDAPDLDEAFRDLLDFPLFAFFFVGGLCFPFPFLFPFRAPVAVLREVKESSLAFWCPAPKS